MFFSLPAADSFPKAFESIHPRRAPESKRKRGLEQPKGLLSGKEGNGFCPEILHARALSSTYRVGPRYGLTLALRTYFASGHSGTCVKILIRSNPLRFFGLDNLCICNHLGQSHLCFGHSHPAFYF